MQHSSRRRYTSWLLVILLVPLALILWPPLYNYDQPELAGLPFYYWFQFLMVIVAVLLTGLLYLLKA